MIGKKDKTQKVEKANDGKAWYLKLNDALFNSMFTALVSLTVLAGSSVYGFIALLGENKLCIAIAVALVILLVSKVLNKLAK